MEKSKYEYCPRCKTESAKRDLAGKLSDKILNSWTCGCGLVMTEKEPTIRLTDEELLAECERRAISTKITK